MKKLNFIIIAICGLITVFTKESLIPEQLPEMKEKNEFSILVQGNFHTELIEGQSTTTIRVEGQMVEQGIHFNFTSHGANFVANDIWTGSLTGTGKVHVMRSEVIDLENGIQKNIIGKRKLFTSEGNLFFDEIGEKNGDIVHVISTISGGTGIYKKATGQLLLEGLHSETDIQFTYSGSITLKN